MMLVRRILHHLWPAVVFACFSLLLIVKVFYLTDCWAYDSNDDLNHTFVNLFASRQILATGEIPQINFYNNFGTPVLGDALTYPFSPQSITYWFLPGPQALTMNRTLIAFMTLMVLYIFFHRYFNPWVSTLLALSAISTPGFFWHFAHHHYQMSLLCFVSLLLVARGHARKPTCDALPLLAGGTLVAVFVLSTSINVVVFALPVYLVSIPLLCRRNPVRVLILALLGTACALIATLPLNLAFIEGIISSYRINANYQMKVCRWDVLTSLITPARWHPPIALYVPLPLAFAALAGAIHARQVPALRSVGTLTLALGIVPILGVSVLIAWPELWWSIPILRSVDITRLFWFSNVFLLLGVGCFGHELIRRGISLPAFAVGILLCTLGWIVAAHADGTRYMLSCQDLILWFFAGTLLLSFGAHWLPAAFAQRFRVAAMLFLLLACASILIPVLLAILGLESPGDARATHFFSSGTQQTTIPPAFVSKMLPGHRVAAEVPSYAGFELTCIFAHLLGSGGRSIIMNSKFTERLLQDNLIEIDDSLSGYHFRRPWQVHWLRRLGIRYVIARLPCPDLENACWTELTRHEGLVLYEDPAHPTPFYTQQEGSEFVRYVRRYRLHGNSAIVSLPPLNYETTLVATFISRPGWQVYVDGEPRQWTEGDDLLIHIPVRPGDRSLRLAYGRVGGPTLCLFSLAGVMVAVISCLLMHLIPQNHNRAPMVSPRAMCRDAPDLQKLQTTRHTHATDPQFHAYLSVCTETPVPRTRARGDARAPG